MFRIEEREAHCERPSSLQRSCVIHVRMIHILQSIRRSSQVRRCSALRSVRRCCQRSREVHISQSDSLVRLTILLAQADHILSAFFASKSSQSSPASANTTMPFNTLPREIKDLIFDNIFDPLINPASTAESHHKHPFHIHYHPLLCVHRRFTRDVESYLMKTRNMLALQLMRAEDAFAKEIIASSEHWTDFEDIMWEYLTEDPEVVANAGRYWHLAKGAGLLSARLVR